MDEYKTEVEIVNEQEEYDVDRENGLERGKSSMTWGIVGIVMTIVLYIAFVIWAAFISARMYYSYSGPNTVLAFIFLGISVFFLIMSIIKLVSGVRALRYSPKVKAILGVAFNAQNIVCFLIYVVIFGFVLAAAM